MTTPPSPSSSHRAYLNRRTRKTLIQAGAKIGRLTDAEKKTPSQKRSERDRKRELKRSGHKEPVALPLLDCWTCCRQGTCKETPHTCTVPTIVHRCLKCSQKVRHYMDPGKSWEYCPSCRIEMERGAK